MQNKDIGPKRFRFGPVVYISFIVWTLLIGTVASIVFPLVCEEDGSWINSETPTVLGGRPFFACYEMYIGGIWAVLAAIILVIVIVITVYLVKKAKLKRIEPHASRKG